MVCALKRVIRELELTIPTSEDSNHTPGNPTQPLLAIHGKLAQVPGYLILPAVTVFHDQSLGPLGLVIHQNEAAPS